MPYFSSTHRNGKGLGIVRKQYRPVGGVTSSIGRYRLLADGAIYDNEKQREVGYIDDNLDEIYKIKGRALQKFLVNYLAR